MEVENLYRMANSMTSTLDTPDREDIIQDAVIYCWQTLQRRACNVSYIYERMKKEILKGVEYYGRQARFIPTENMHELVTHTDPEPIYLPLMDESKGGLTKKQRKTIEALLRNNFERDTAARELGLKKERVTEHWRRAKPVLKFLYQNL